MNLHMGTHANKDIAIIRALTEIIQNRAANLDNNKFHISMLRDVDYMREDQLSPITSFYLESFRKGSAVVVPYENVKNFDTDDITTELNYVISNLQKSGFEVLSINITNEKLGIACVRVAIPGLQPMIFELFDDLSSKDIRFSRFIKR